jgi:hypothetical protein
MGLDVPGARALASTALKIAALGACLAAASCGGSPVSPSPSSPSNPSTVPSLRGGERLSWDQSAASVQDASAYQYKLYVDGRPATFDDIRCGAGSGSALYLCSGRLPSMSTGSHVLELSASMRGVESTRSSPLTVNVTASSQASEAAL